MFQLAGFKKKLIIEMASWHRFKPLHPFFIPPDERPHSCRFSFMASQTRTGPTPLPSFHARLYIPVQGHGRRPFSQNSRTGYMHALCILLDYERPYPTQPPIQLLTSFCRPLLPLPPCWLLVL